MNSMADASTSEADNFRGSEDRICRICSDRSDGAHFGVDACRACAAFFRRSVVTGRKYVCRQGGNNCEINKSVRCMCRKCRLRKCLEAGMHADIPRRVDPAPLSATATTSASDSEVARTPHTSAFQVVQPFFSANKPEMPNLLYRVSQNYRHLCDVRRSTEMAMNMPSLRGMFSTPGPLQDLFPASTTKVSEIQRAHLPAIGEFVIQSFEEFSLLNQDEKWALFQAFLINLWGIDTSYRSYKRLTPDQFAHMILCTETTYIDVNRLEEFLGDSSTSKLPISDLVNLVKLGMTRQRQKPLRLMQEMNISEEEVAALIGLALWNPNNEKSTERVEELAKEMRAKIFDNLHALYTLNNTPSYAQRFGELMCLFSSILHQQSRLAEDMELFNLYDAFSQDSFIYDMMKK